MFDDFCKYDAKFTAVESIAKIEYFGEEERGG